jgi:cytochrome c biogenesis protein CcmG/thiol:disulfide interchange protein DsbE
MPPRTARTCPGLLLATAVAAVSVALAGCGGGDAPESTAPDYAEELAGSPKPLAALHDQESELLGGGTDAFQARLRSLRGYPVVVNKWASWCGPCRAEFPHFQQVAARLGKRIAFLGVDSNDSDSAAREFLAELPVPYPSYLDPDQEIAKLLEAEAGFPATAFYDRRGRLVYTHLGEYATRADLEAEIRRYAG